MASIDKFGLIVKFEVQNNNDSFSMAHLVRNLNGLPVEVRLRVPSMDVARWLSTTNDGERYLHDILVRHNVIESHVGRCADEEEKNLDFEMAFTGPPGRTYAQMPGLIDIQTREEAYPSKIVEINL